MLIYTGALEFTSKKLLSVFGKKVKFTFMNQKIPDISIAFIINDS